MLQLITVTPATKVELGADATNEMPCDYEVPCPGNPNQLCGCVNDPTADPRVYYEMLADVEGMGEIFFSAYSFIF